MVVLNRSDVLAHITACVASTPQSLGDPKKDTAEELEERHERVVTASLSAAADLLTTMQQAAAQQQEGTEASCSAEAASTAGAAAAAGALQGVHEKVAEILATPGFFKQKLNSKSPVVQRAAYGFIQAVSSTAPQLLKPCLGAAAPSVLGALQVSSLQHSGSEPLQHLRIIRTIYHKMLYCGGLYLCDSTIFARSTAAHVVLWAWGRHWQSSFLLSCTPP